MTFAAEVPFDTVFAGFVPNAQQAAAIELASKQSSPYLMIIEVPMGQGKTEAALYAADMAMCRGFARGMYIAMPTQATGNAMLERVLDDYLKKRGHQGKLNLQLVHGDALLAHKEVKEGEIPNFNPHSIGEERDVHAQSWFTAKKRPLLAPFGVGTIDYAEFFPGVRPARTTVHSGLGEGMLVEIHAIARAPNRLARQLKEA